MGKQTRVGTAWESEVVGFLRTALSDSRIARAARHGSRDVGDVYGLELAGEPFVVECKAAKRLDFSEWMGELETEKRNAGAVAGVLVVKRRMRNVKDAYAVMTLDDFANLYGRATQ